MDKEKDKNKKPEMKQDVNVNGSEKIIVIQAGRDVNISEPRDLPPTDYKEYFERIAKLRKDVFAHLGNWVDLYAVETRLTKWQEHERGKTAKATDLVDECVRTDKNVLIFGESGAGKTFTCLKLLEGLKEDYGKKEETTNKKIPIFVELSQVKDNDLEEFVRGYVGISKTQFDSDRAKYVIFLDGLNEVGDLKRQKSVFSEIRKFGELNRETRLIVTTQTLSEYHQCSGFELYEIQPFKKEDVIAYLAQFRDKF
ncbi:MAG: NACHT domain-containing protein, partial [Candidatus Anammoxibacter sp.]